MSDSAQGPGWWQASDGKWYPPQPQAPPPPPTTQFAPPPPIAQFAPPPQAGMSGCLKFGLIALGVLAVLGIGSCVVLATVVDKAAEDIGEDLLAQNEREARDVSRPDCRIDETTGFMEAEMTVTNQSSERSNYAIEVTFEDGDVQLETAFAAVTALEPGQNTVVVAGSSTEPTGAFTCRVIGVQRFSDVP